MIDRNPAKIVQKQYCKYFINNAWNKCKQIQKTMSINNTNNNNNNNNKNDNNNNNNKNQNKNNDTLFVKYDDQYYLEVQWQCQCSQKQKQGNSNNSCRIELIDYKNQSKLKKYTKIVKLGQQSNVKGLQIFDSNTQFIKFLQLNQQDIQIQGTEICFGYQINENGFNKNVMIKIQLLQLQLKKKKDEEGKKQNQGEMQENQMLKCMNKILKRKLEQNKMKFVEKSIKNQNKISQNFAQIGSRKNMQISKTNIIDVDYDDDDEHPSQDDQQVKKNFGQNQNKLREKCKIIAKKNKDVRRQLRKQRKLKTTARKTISNATIQIKQPKQNDKKPSINSKSSYKQHKLPNNKTRIDYQNGDYYIGQLKNNNYCGQGFFYSKKLGTYQGQWRNNMANGYGISIDQHGNKMKGYFKDDKRYGEGIDQYANGDRYEGHFHNQMKTGKGKYISKNGVIYEGEFKNDNSHGFGKQYYVDGSWYEGHWKQDLKHGKGILHQSVNNNGNKSSAKSKNNRNIKKGVRVEQIWENGNLISSITLDRGDGELRSGRNQQISIDD